MILGFVGGGLMAEAIIKGCLDKQVLSPQVVFSQSQHIISCLNTQPLDDVFGHTCNVTLDNVHDFPT